MINPVGMTYENLQKVLHQELMQCLRLTYAKGQCHKISDFIFFSSENIGLDELIS
jgi:hypothetical protein